MPETLPPDVEQELNTLVANGLYDSPADALRAALAALRDRDDERELSNEEIRRALDEGQTDVDAGRVKPLGRQAIEEMKHRILADLDRSGTGAAK